MIRQIRGKVLSTDSTSAIIDVAGFGIEVYMSNPESVSVDNETTLASYLAIKKNGMELYGFTDTADRDFFELVLTVSGIGPKTALSILRRASRESLEGAINTRDLTYLTKIVGLGKKSAEKIVIELHDKTTAHSHDSADNEVFDTLVALGYTEREARSALQSIPESISGKEDRIKSALSSKN